MRKATLSILSVIGAGAIAAIAVVSTRTPVDELRPARLPKPCEVTTGNAADWKEKCPGGLTEHKDFCLCLALKSQGTIDNEQEVPPIDKRERLVVCNVKGNFNVRSEPNTGDVDKTCTKVAENLVFPGITMRNIETDLVTALMAACFPCPVSGASWGPCPRCLHPDYGKTCAEACAPPPEVITP